MGRGKYISSTLRFEFQIDAPGLSSIGVEHACKEGRQIDNED